MKNPTIIHINMASGFGGGEVQTLNLISHLAEFPQVVLAKKNSLFEKKVIRTFKGNDNVNTNSFFSALIHCWSDKNTVIHAHDGRGAHIARIISKLSGVKFVISRRVDKPLKGKLSEKTYHSASSIIAVSEKVAKNLIGLNSSLKVIYDSYSNLPASSDVERSLAILESKFVVTQLGSLIDVKNVSFTIELAKRLEKSHPNIHFLIVGEGKDEMILKKQAKGLSNITFFGFTTFVASIMKRTDLLFMPSKSEGLGSAVLEAYQHGIPVVTSNVGGLPEIVDEGITGYQFKLGDIETAEDRVVSLYTDNTLYNRLVSQINAYKVKYSPENMAQSYKRCYQDCLATKF